MSSDTMLVDLQDTIVALSSAPGPGSRAIVRLSGSKAVEVVSQCFQGKKLLTDSIRQSYEGSLALTTSPASLPADIYVWPKPHTYTGQLLLEVHTISCMPLVEKFIGQCLREGARPAQPGEFTMRGFLAGKLDLPRAEAVYAVIEAGSRTELREALSYLAGGLSQPLNLLRDDLLDLLADLEAGLDFVDEDIEFVTQAHLLERLQHGITLLSQIQAQLNRRSVHREPFRVVLAGKPNAGKSSLFNTLGSGKAIVSHEAGTTRDYLVQTLDISGVAVELIDTAGWQHSTEEIDGQAQELGRDQITKADLILLCVQGNRDLEDDETSVLETFPDSVVIVRTKCDIAPITQHGLRTSAASGEGHQELLGLLEQRAGQARHLALAPSLSRCEGHLDRCLEHLTQAKSMAESLEPQELVAMELRGGLDQLGEMVGAVYTNDMLDRIFSRFCIGK
ncbi:MAG: tRNA modification GTPase [Gemmataceae bacterium]